MQTFIKLTIVAVFMTGAAGCKKSEPVETTTNPAIAMESPSSAPSASARAKNPRPRLGRWVTRPERLLAVALDTLTLTPPQRATLVGLERRVGEERGTTDAERAFRTALAESARAGTIDPARLSQHPTALEQEAQRKQDATAKLLDELHKTLDPAQRKALVAAVRKEQATRDGLRQRSGMTSQSRTSDEIEGLQAERLARHLGLNENKTKELRKIQVKWPNAHLSPNLDQLRADNEASLTELVGAFEADSFSANKLAMVTSVPKTQREQAEREVERFKAMLPRFSAEEREKLAVYAERGFPAHRPWRGQGAAAAQAAASQSSSMVR